MAGVIAEIAAGAALAGLGVGGMFYASLWPTSQVFGRTLIAGNDPEEIALTFDDGPNDTATPQLLEVLARHDVRATFFTMGSFARMRTDLVRQMVAAGHVVGNHTMTHPKLSVEPAERVRQELNDCNAVLEDITGVAVRFFRPPFGARRPMVLRAARNLGLTPVLWNVTGFDWGEIGVDAILGRLEAGIARNRRRARASTLLLHDGGHLGMGADRMDTVHAVERLLEAHASDGTRFVTVDAWADA